MLEFVRGAVERVTSDAAVISVGGVGLRVEMPAGDLARLRGTVTVHTVLHLKDEAAHLYGFLSERAREVFRALVTVSGVGPKLALAVLSAYSPQTVERAVASGDAALLATVSGVGKRKAERIVLELREKLGALAEAAPPAGPLAEVRAALDAMGFTPAEIAEALKGLPPDGDAPTLLRFALRALGEPAKAAR